MQLTCKVVYAGVYAKHAHRFCLAQSRFRHHMVSRRLRAAGSTDCVAVSDLFPQHNGMEATSGPLNHMGTISWSCQTDVTDNVPTSWQPPCSFDKAGSLKHMLLQAADDKRRSDEQAKRKAEEVERKAEADRKDAADQQAEADRKAQTEKQAEADQKAAADRVAAEKAEQEAEAKAKAEQQEAEQKQQANQEAEAKAQAEQQEAAAKAEKERKEAEQ